MYFFLFLMIFLFLSCHWLYISCIIEKRELFVENVSYAPHNSHFECSTKELHCLRLSVDSSNC